MISTLTVVHLMWYLVQDDGEGGEHSHPSADQVTAADRESVREVVHRVGDQVEIALSVGK